MKVIYRISDGGYSKIKPEFVTKRGVFLHFLKIFAGHDIYVIADNVVDDTYDFLCKNVNSEKIFKTKLSNAGAFMYAVNFALTNFDDNDKVYFAEDDYIYTKDAAKIIAEGLDIADYSSGYDHPDKYMNHCEGGPNPFISDGGELTRVLVSESRHWKITNSCCMTFACKVRTIKQDLRIYQKFCGGKHPHDFQMFCELSACKRKLVSCIPAVSTHGETAWLSKFVDWRKAFEDTL